MKYLIMLHPDAKVLDALSEDERKTLYAGHEAFMKTIKESGEFVGTFALAGADQSAVVRVHGGVPAVTDGPYAEAKEMVGGAYVIDVESRERALEVAAMIPDAEFEGLGVELRPVIFCDGKVG